MYICTYIYIYILIHTHTQIHKCIIACLLHWYNAYMLTLFIELCNLKIFIMKITSIFMNILSVKFEDSNPARCSFNIIAQSSQRTTVSKTHTTKFRLRFRFWTQFQCFDFFLLVENNFLVINFVFRVSLVTNLHPASRDSYKFVYQVQFHPRFFSEDLLSCFYKML